MLKELRVICALMLLISMNLLSMTLEDQFSQEHKFHEKLVNHDLIKYGMQAYYKKIKPITSQSTPGADQWRIADVSIAGQKIRSTINGIYTHEDISFTIDPAIAFDHTEPLDILITHGEKSINTRFNNVAEKKVLALPAFSSLKDISDAIYNNKLSLIRYVTLKGTVHIPGEKRWAISVEGRNQCAQPITLCGMEVVCSKDAKKTEIFFDFVDKNNDSIDLVSPIRYDHSEAIADEKIVCIKDHRAYVCTGKKIYGLFDSLETRNKWVLDESNFYDQNQHKLLSLPSCYSNLDGHQEMLKEEIVWIFGDDHDSLYQLDSAEHLKDSNNYIYKDDGVFFLTLPYKATYKECFSHNNKKEFDYLVQVSKPHIVIRDDVEIEGGRRNWSTGIYERICENDRSSWQMIGSPVDDVINFCDKVVRTNTKFPIEPLDTRESKQWCDAAQRFFACFATKIHSCNQEIANGLKVWSNLIKLNLSHVRLENGLQWNDVFTSLGTMTQLTSLHFENNHPVDNLFMYEKAIGPVTDYYRSLGACLKKLTKLNDLHLQGLWLKSHERLGHGYRNLGWVSPEVANLTGIIYWRQLEVKAIIQNICALKYLENLSIDGIPNHGSSDFSRHTHGQRFLFAPLWIITTPLQVVGANCHDADLKKLTEVCADQLAQMALLKTISVYSPGGSYVDYFSKAFKERLTNAKPALSRLTIIAKEL